MIEGVALVPLQCVFYFLKLFFNSTSTNLKLFGMASECEEEIGNGLGTQRLMDEIVQLKVEITDGKVCLGLDMSINMLLIFDFADQTTNTGSSTDCRP
jgi:hypothetical protein